MGLTVQRGDAARRGQRDWSTVSVSGSLSAGSVTSGNVAASKLKLGNGAARGTNYVQGYHSTTYTVPNSVWQTLGWNSMGYNVMDDGTMWTAGSSFYLSTVPGIYHMELDVTYGTNAVGRRLARIMSQGGTVLAQDGQNASEHISAHCSATAYLSGGGYYVYIQTFQDSGGTLTNPAHGGQTPSQFIMTQIA